MNVDVEKILSSELREVADGLQVPPLPALPQQPPRRQGHWVPMLVAAAAIVLVVAGVVAVVNPLRGSEPTRPAPTPTASPTASPTATARALTTSAPTVAYLFEGRLYVDGEQVPGTWWIVQNAGDTWLAQRDDDTWWWGTDAEPLAISGEVSGQPQLSPDGELLAVASARDGGQVLLADTRSGGAAVGTLPIDVGNPRGSDALGVVAVTDDGKVFLQSPTRRLMWLGRDGDETVDLDITAADQWVRGSTSVGLVVLDGKRDGESDATYLAEVSESGQLTRLHPLPSEDAVVSPAATWLAYGGSWGGESATIPSIQAETIAGGEPVTLEPPDDRALLALAWEDDDLLIAELHSDGTPTGLARCSIRDRRCLVIDTD